MLHDAVSLSELSILFKKRVVIDGTPVLLIYLDGKVFAIQDHCPHMGASLAKGSILDQQVKCRLHGASFDVNTGEVMEKPHIGPIKMPTKHAKTFPTIIREGIVYVEL